jgi:hypothetical protein
MALRRQRASSYFGLSLPQAALDFVDIDVRRDTPLFLDPSALLLIDSEWAARCRSLLQHFFHTVLEAIRAGNGDRARTLLSVLREPNEAHLGFSRGRSRGHGMGRGLAERMWESLSESPAVQSGLLVDLQDTALMVEGIDRDIVSDISINIIREPLIGYTRRVCDVYEIDTETVDSGPLWQPHRGEWITRFEDLPMGPDGRLLLIPKTLVRHTLTYRPAEYYRHFLLTHLQDVHLRANSALVTVLRNGERRVYKNRLEQEYGSGKPAAADLTVSYPEVLEDYRREKRRDPSPPLDESELAEATRTPPTNWEELLESVTSIQPGGSSASDYHGAVSELLTALFYPSLVFPEVEQEIHEGRKRIDVVFTNQARGGFFAHARDNYVAPYIMVECKNYSGDPGNPELDQLSGRFSNRRGWVGILCCRSFDDKELFIKRCRDTANDDRGFIVPLDDSDLNRLVEDHQTGETLDEREALIRDRFNRLVF